MKDTAGYRKPIWDELSRQLKVDKVYFETHRDLLIVDRRTLDNAKKFFTDRGIVLAGSITYTVRRRVATNVRCRPGHYFGYTLPKPLCNAQELPIKLHD